MITSDFSYKIYTDKILHLEWAAVIDNEQMQRIKEFAFELKTNKHLLLTDIVPAYHSLTLYLKDKIINQSQLVETLRELYTLSATVPNHNGKTWEVPVVYGGSRGPDLDSVCKKLKMDPVQLIEKHTAPIYDVHFIGFLPGFPYLGGLDPELKMTRKDVPAISVVSGSVGIGGNQTGIYPVNSPGGWHIIGNTPFPLFDPQRHPQIVIQSHDRIKFYSIQESEIEASKMKISEEIQKSLTN